MDEGVRLALGLFVRLAGLGEELPALRRLPEHLLELGGGPVPESAPSGDGDPAAAGEQQKYPVTKRRSPPVSKTVWLS
jgi:hypothetical protein